MIEVNNCTLFSVDCVQPELAAHALKKSCEQIKFKTVKLAHLSVFIIIIKHHVRQAEKRKNGQMDGWRINCYGKCLMGKCVIYLMCDL